MAPSTVKSSIKKKREREKREGDAGASASAPGAHGPKQRRRRVQRDNSQAPGAHTISSLI
jgi:hypothetical protein